MYQDTSLYACLPSAHSLDTFSLPHLSAPRRTDGPRWVLNKYNNNLICGYVIPVTCPIIISLIAYRHQVKVKVILGGPSETSRRWDKNKRITKYINTGNAITDLHKFQHCCANAMVDFMEMHFYRLVVLFNHLWWWWLLLHLFSYCFPTT